MDLQFYGANCISLTYKGRRVVADDNLSLLGGKSILKVDDVALNSNLKYSQGLTSVARLSLDGPGEYEVSDISVIGFAARAHTDEPGQMNATIFKLVAGDQSVLLTGHIYPELNETQLEEIGLIDVMVVPVGGGGYTLDPIGALKLIKDIEPKLVVPTHYNDKSLKFPIPQLDLEVAIRELAMEPKESLTKLRLKGGELSEVTQLVVLEKVTNG